MCHIFLHFCFAYNPTLTEHAVNEFIVNFRIHISSSWKYELLPTLYIIFCIMYLLHEHLPPPPILETCKYHTCIPFTCTITYTRASGKYSNKPCKAKNFILTLMCMWHIRSKWYVSDLHVVITGTEACPSMAPRLIMKSRQKWCRVCSQKVKVCFELAYVANTWQPDASQGVQKGLKSLRMRSGM